MKIMSASNQFSIARLELLCSTGTNFFVASNSTYLHDLVSSSDTLGSTRGSKAAIDFKVSLRESLAYEKEATIMQTKDDPCAVCTPYNIFPFVSFTCFGFK